MRQKVRGLFDKWISEGLLYLSTQELLQKLDQHGVVRRTRIGNTWRRTAVSTESKETNKHESDAEYSHDKMEHCPKNSYLKVSLYPETELFSDTTKIICFLIN